jgi:hypothetical protein
MGMYRGDYKVNRRNSLRQKKSAAETAALQVLVFVEI